MPPLPPLVLVENAFDRIRQFPAAVLSASSSIVGREPQYVADYRRERSYWQAATTATFHYVMVDLGAGNTLAPDYLFVDRGHNLAGKTLLLEGSNNGSSWDQNPVNYALTHDGVNRNVTEEGGFYTLFTAPPARRYWRLSVSNSWQPLITGLMLGRRTQLARFAKKLDEDAGGRTERSQESDAGYKAVDRVYDYRTLELSLGLIGASEYDTTMRQLRTLLFSMNQPAVVAMDTGTYPERAWMYQFDGRSWSMGKDKVYRSGTIPMRELYPVIR